MHLRPLGHATADEVTGTPGAGRIRPGLAVRRRCGRGSRRRSLPSRRGPGRADPRAGSRASSPGPRTPPIAAGPVTTPTSPRTVLMVPVLLTSVMPRSGSACASGSRPNAYGHHRQVGVGGDPAQHARAHLRRDDAAAMQAGHQVGQLIGAAGRQGPRIAGTAVVTHPVEQRRAYEAQRPGRDADGVDADPSHEHVGGEVVAEPADQPAEVLDGERVASHQVPQAGVGDRSPRRCAPSSSPRSSSPASAWRAISISRNSLPMLAVRSDELRRDGRQHLGRRGVPDADRPLDVGRQRRKAHCHTVARKCARISRPPSSDETGTRSSTPCMPDRRRPSGSAVAGAKP